MHYVTYPFKRAHHISLKVLRPIAARHGLTPARFDLLKLLLGGNHEPSVIPHQVALAKVLNVCRSTICKMVRSLEAAGLLVREVNHYDRRYRFLKLTRHGRRCLRGVMKTLRSREIDRMFDDSVAEILDTSREAPSEFIRSLVQRVLRFNIAVHREFGPKLYPMPPG
jgi:DNA-binding MarR family transcriptional regulator